MIAAAAVTAYTSFTAGFSAYAAEAPTDIHLTVQTKEIDIDDIPADRVVTLDIYQENCPAFDAIMIPVIKDSRLSYYPEDNCFGLAEGVWNARRPDIGFYDPDPDYRKCDICSSANNDDFVEFDNAIATVSVKLPDQVSVGDFFGVDIVGKYMNTSIQINIGLKRADMFTESAFSQLNSGGIRIVQVEQPVQPQDGNGGGGDQSAGDSGGAAQSPGEEPQSGDNSITQETPAAAQTAAISTSVSTAVTSADKTTMTSTVQSTSSTTSEKTSTGSTAATNPQSTSTDIVTGAPEETEKKSNGGFITIALITLIIVAVTSTALLAEKLRMNRK